MALPGCVNGNCINPSNGQAEAFTCHCKPSWDGALCDIRKFMDMPVKLLDYDIWDSLFFQQNVPTTVITMGFVQSQGRRRAPAGVILVGKVMNVRSASHLKGVS